MELIEKRGLFKMNFGAPAQEEIDKVLPYCYSKE